MNIYKIIKSKSFRSKSRARKQLSLFTIDHDSLTTIIRRSRGRARSFSWPGWSSACPRWSPSRRLSDLGVRVGLPRRACRWSSGVRSPGWAWPLVAGPPGATSRADVDWPWWCGRSRRLCVPVKKTSMLADGFVIFSYWSNI